TEGGRHAVPGVHAVLPGVGRARGARPRRGWLGRAVLALGRPGRAATRTGGGRRTAPRGRGGGPRAVGGVPRRAAGRLRRPPRPARPRRDLPPLGVAEVRRGTPA